ncbi:MAG TPA: DUF362 domain-containing protein [Candidatus Cloacimonetes bacterium]|nr:DUF362 domain-containing protein [Candidatus Cloacimonadota bacterium]HEX37913.1 DUF362 domain-containing protein [Candidatus Cloacimonadota bacterium]
MKSKVYFIDFHTTFQRNIFDKIDDALDRAEFNTVYREYDKVAVKMHFGAENNFGVINPRYVRYFVNRLLALDTKPFLVDTNTLYAGHRVNSIDHLNLAVRHGYAPSVVNAPVIIADGLKGQSEEVVPIDTKETKKAFIGSDIHHADAILALTHLTGHMETGFGAAIKNLGMGCASRRGKLAMHSVSKPTVNRERCIGCARCAQWCQVNAIEIKDGKAHIDEKTCTGCSMCLSVCPFTAIKIHWDSSHDYINAKITEYAYAVAKHKKDKIFFVNFLNNITKLCDCVSIHGEQLVPDIGILFSKDIVAVDRASIDLLNEAAGRNILKKLFPDIEWEDTFSYAEKLGMGSIDYELVKIK